MYQAAGSKGDEETRERNVYCPNDIAKIRQGRSSIGRSPFCMHLALVVKRYGVMWLLHTHLEQRPHFQEHPKRHLEQQRPPFHQKHVEDLIHRQITYVWGGVYSSSCTVL